MTNPHKAAGTRFESAVRDYLNAELEKVGTTVRAYRPRQMGTQDVGDIHVGNWVLQAKAWADLTSALREGTDGAQRQAVAAHYPLGAAVIKRPRRGVQDAYVVIPLAVFAALVAERYTEY